MDSSKTKAEARQKAVRLLEKMETKGWKIEVWENMGWHYKVFNRGLSVRAHQHRSKYTYSTMLGREPDHGCGIWTERERGPFKDPNKAVRNCVEYARECLNEYIVVLEAAEEVLTVKV